MKIVAEMAIFRLLSHLKGELKVKILVFLRNSQQRKQ